MAKAKVLEDLALINDHDVFKRGEEVYALWFDANGEASVFSKDDLPEDNEGWTLHIQQIGMNSEQLFDPNEWDFDDTSTDSVEIVEQSWQPDR